MRIIVWTILIAAVGFGAGYAIYGKVGNDYLSIHDIFLEPKSLFDTVAVSALRTKEKRQAILASTGVGAGFGLLAGLIHSFASVRRQKSGE